jgi:hypothetical protein
MVLQFENAVDVLKALHPESDFVFLFKHNALPARQKTDGLNQHRKHKAFGGEADLMQEVFSVSVHESFNQETFNLWSSSQDPTLFLSG